MVLGKIRKALHPGIFYFRVRKQTCMKSARIFLLLFLPLSLFFACQKAVVVAPPEYKTDAGPMVSREPSYISIPVSLSYETIKKSVNKSLGNVLYNDDSFENNDNDDIKVRVTQTGDIRIVGYKEYLKVSLPVQIFFAGRYLACDICPEISKSTTFEMEADFVTKISLNPDWSLNTFTESKGFNIKKDPYMSLGPLNINIRLVVEKLLQSQLKSLTQLLDKTVKENFALKKYAEDAWKELQKPILADSTYNAWLYFNPKEFIMAPLNAGKDRLTIKGALLTEIDTKLGEKPSPKNVKLPGLTIREDFPPQFRIELPVEIDFPEATRQARAAFQDTTITLTKKKYIHIDDIEIFGRGGEVFIKVRMSGTVRATIYLKGKPAFDSEKSEIYFANLDYELNTQQAMLKAASWLLKSTLKKKMESAFRYNVKDDIEGAKASINTFLNGYVYDDLLEVKGSLGNLSMKGVSADEKAIRVVFFAEGKATVKILNLNF